MTSDRFMIVLGRIDVNKKPFRLIQIPDFLKRDPASRNCLKQIEWPPLASFDQFCRTLPAGVDAVQRGERLRPAVFLNWDHGVMVQPHVGQVQEEFGSNERKITSDDDGPFTMGGSKSSMKAAERSPLRINIWNDGEVRSV